MSIDECVWCDAIGLFVNYSSGIEHFLSHFFLFFVLFPKQNKLLVKALQNAQKNLHLVFDSCDKLIQTTSKLENEITIMF